MYIWNVDKQLMPKKIVHISKKNGKSFCKAENNNKFFTETGEKKPKKSRVCKVCIQNRDRDSFYVSEIWADLRYRALSLNDGCCQLCGRSKHDGIILHVDHIKPRSKHPELQYSLSNLQVLCAMCNWGKGSNDETDWREPSLKKLMGEEI